MFLCLGVELIFSSNRIMWLLLFPIQSVTISFVQDQVTADVFQRYNKIGRTLTGIHVPTLSNKNRCTKSVPTGVHAHFPHTLRLIPSLFGQL